MCCAVWSNLGWAGMLRCVPACFALPMASRMTPDLLAAALLCWLLTAKVREPSSQLDEAAHRMCLMQDNRLTSAGCGSH